MSAFGFPPPNDPGLSPPRQYTGVNVMSPAYNAKGDGTTDDTAAIQAAIDAASALAPSNGIVDVILPAGYGFHLTQLTPRNGVRLWCYGATIIPVVQNNGLLYAANTGLSRFEVRGGTWQGTGLESGNNNQFLFYNGFGSNACSDIVLKDMIVPVWGTCVFYIRNPSRARVLDNTILQVTDNDGNLYNAIGIQGSGTGQANDVKIRGNTIEKSWAAAISWTNAATNAGTPVKMLVEGNTCTGDPASPSIVSGAIDIENDVATGGPYSQFIIRGNSVTNNGTHASARGIELGGSGGTAANSETLCIGNIVHSNQVGIYNGSGTDVTVAYNRVTAPTPFSLIAGTLQTGNRISSGPMQGRAALVAGTVTINTAEIMANDNVTVARVGGGTGSTVWGALAVPGGTITAGTSFVINSSNASDNSTVFWRIDH